MADGLFITHAGRSYFIRPEILTLCQVSDSDLAEIKRHGTLPDAPVVQFQPRNELSIEELGKAVGGLSAISTTATAGTAPVVRDTIMCPW